jgi:hypothetical protein
VYWDDGGWLADSDSDAGPVPFRRVDLLRARTTPKNEKWQIEIDALMTDF